MQINDYIYDISQYINPIFDLKTDIKSIGKEGLNIFLANITASYLSYTANLLEREIILLYSADSSAYTPEKIQKQKKLIERKVQSLPIHCNK